jgi:hypothetical protein
VRVAPSSLSFLPNFAAAMLPPIVLAISAPLLLLAGGTWAQQTAWGQCNASPSPLSTVARCLTTSPFPSRRRHRLRGRDHLCHWYVLLHWASPAENPARLTTGLGPS